MFSKKRNDFEKKVLFVGIPDMAYVCLDGLSMAGVNIAGVVGPKKDHPTYQAFKDFVYQRGLNFIEYEALDDVFFINKIKNLDADIAVVCSFNYKVPKMLLNSVKGGFINVHPSLLPKYRGPNPYSAAILGNEVETGVTLHFMDETFDTGDIISQKKIAVSEVETMGTLFNRTNILALDMLLETLQKFEKTELEKVKQPQGIFEIAPLIPEELLTINFSKSAIEINNLIRAVNPFILARTNFRGTMIKVLSADVVGTSSYSDDEVGSIVDIDENNFYIATKSGLLSLTSMQFGSFFAGTSKEFIKILNPRIGEKFS